MNREILFRGKRIDNGEWVEGYYTVIKGTHYISQDPQTGVYLDIEVIPSTVGQFNEYDNNFEGDMVKISWSKPSTGGYLQSSDMTVEVEYICEVVFNGRSFMYRKKDGRYLSFPNSATMVIIGTIHDNTTQP